MTKFAKLKRKNVSISLLEQILEKMFNFNRFEHGIHHIDENTIYVYGVNQEELEIALKKHDEIISEHGDIEYIPDENEEEIFAKQVEELHISRLTMAKAILGDPIARQKLAEEVARVEEEHRKLEKAKQIKEKINTMI